MVWTLEERGGRSWLKKEEVYKYRGCRQLEALTQLSVLVKRHTLPHSLTTITCFTMRFTTIAVALSAATIASAQLTFNVTQALKPGNFAKYRCL